MRHAARLALFVAASFLLVVAVLLNSAALFYMTTAVFATIGACRLQAWLSVKGLHFDRHAPENVKVGELVTIDITVWSDRRIKRPLVSVTDALPSKLAYTDRTPSLPIAPAFDVPIQTQYSFRPLRRGRFRWSGLKVVGTDALGLVNKEKIYETTPVEVLVLPNPAPLEFEIPPAPAYGISESETGHSRGAGIEPRGVREYVSGDSLRYVHWRSSARANKLLVKEFTTGSHTATSFVFQRTHGTEIGEGGATTLEQMCANAAYMAEKMLRQGAEIAFPTLGAKISTGKFHDLELLALLATVEADSDRAVSEEVEQARRAMGAGGLIFAFIGVADESLPQEVRRCLAMGCQVVAMIYDAREYETLRSKLGDFKSAADTDYLNELRGAGTRVQVVPKHERLMVNGKR